MANFWFKFEWETWRQDKDLRRCSLETRGFWLECLCLMYEEGVCFLEGRPTALANLIGCDVRKFNRCVEELEREKAASVRKSQGLVKIISRRLLKKANLREYNRLKQSEHRAKQNVKSKSNDPSKDQSLRVLDLKKDSSYEESKEGEKNAPASEFGSPKNIPADKSFFHPAIKAVREISGHNPDPVTYKKLIGILGEDFNRSKLENCFIEWRLKKFRADNCGWITDWYVTGIPEKGNQNGTSQKLSEREKSASRAANAESLADALERKGRAEIAAEAARTAERNALPGDSGSDYRKSDLVSQRTGFD